ncbi:response regulator [Methanogenium organophilum]|uniref:Response regulator n=1 Tax=Methanogenium organophilum TaxID=2199 RepID=A0A9X9S2R8_METOG|nr:response regulator [Methanogenium organophilum]WAI00435.1 response regulator [Methanogenium organophilum]
MRTLTKILIIEDNPNNLYLIRFILNQYDYEVIEAESGEEGVRKAEAEVPDLIVMDIRLPGIDGFEATRLIRESETTAEIPVIALTSYAMAGDRERILSLGCTGYIEKPIEPDTIIAQLTHYL